MTATTFASGCLEIPLTGALLFAGGEIAAVANPEGLPLIIVDAKIYIDTPSTGGCNLSAGLAADAVTADTDMINALAVDGAVTGLAYHGITALAAKGAALVWGTTQYLTVSGSADSTGFAGRLYVNYIRVD